MKVKLSNVIVVASLIGICGIAFYCAVDHSSEVGWNQPSSTAVAEESAAKKESSLPDSALRSSPRRSPALELGINDLSSFLSRITQQSDSASLLDEKSRVFAYWMKEDPWRFRNVAEQMESSATRNEALADCVKAFVQRRDAIEAIRTLEKFPPSDLRAKSIRLIAAAFAESTSFSVLKWAESLSVSDRAAVGLALVETFSKVGRIDDIADVLNGIQDPVVRQLGLSAITSSLKRGGNIEELGSWMGQLDPSAQDQVRASLAGFQSADLPSAERTIQAIKDPSQRGRARQVILQQLFSNSTPAVAAKWVLEISNEEDQLATLYPLVSRWNATDSQSLEKWMTDLPQGRVKNATIRAYANNLRPSNPGKANEWLSQIEKQPVKAIP